MFLAKRVDGIGFLVWGVDSWDESKYEISLKFNYDVVEMYMEQGYGKEITDTNLLEFYKAIL